ETGRGGDENHRDQQHEADAATVLASAGAVERRTAKVSGHILLRHDRLATCPFPILSASDAIFAQGGRVKRVPAKIRARRVRKSSATGRSSSLTALVDLHAEGVVMGGRPHLFSRAISVCRARS